MTAKTKPKTKKPARTPAALSGVFLRSQEEIDEVLNRICDDSDAGRHRFPGQTYAEGVEAAIKWLTEKDYTDSPYPDE